MESGKTFITALGAKPYGLHLMMGKKAARELNLNQATLQLQPSINSEDGAVPVVTPKISRGWRSRKLKVRRRPFASKMNWYMVRILTDSQ
jgi:hypothetical protein